MKLPVRRKFLWLKIPAVLLGLASAVTAEVFGNFTYVDNGPDVTITGYAEGAPTNVTIPAAITVSEDPVVIKSVVRIGSSAFEGRFELTSVTIPSGVTNIDNRAFFDCTGITTVTIPPTVTSIGKSAFAYCSALTNMQLQSGLLMIGIEAFFRCGALTSVTIPEGVTAVGIGAFSYCSGLASVEVPSSMTTISSGTFTGCSGLTSVTLPATVTSIGTFAFQYCSGLTSVTLPNVSNLQNKVFANCRGLTSVNIPASVTTISATAFAQCSLLTSFTVDAANPNFSSVGGLLTNKGQTRLITCPGGVSGNFTIPTALTEIGIQAFQNCATLTGVTFHAGVTSLGNQAFSTCSALVQANFEGNAPAMGLNVFELTASGFKIYYLNSSTGFESPTWYGYPAIGTGIGGEDLSSWLLSKGLPADTDVTLDDNGDGVNLLMAYALNLDPNLHNSFPQPVFGENLMTLRFYAGSNGITYVVKTSSDMVNWSAEGVTLSDPDADQFRTATVNIFGPSRFMRLEVNN